MSFTKDHSSETGNESSHLLDGVGRRILGGHGLGLESGKKKYVPVHRGWFITNNNAVFCTEEETWTYVIRQKEKLWR